MVDAAAVAATFQRMSRIADATGIPLDKDAVIASYGTRQLLSVEQYGSARNTDRHRTLPVRIASKLASLISIRLIPKMLRIKKGLD